MVDLQGRELLRRAMEVVPPGGDPTLDGAPLPNASDAEGDAPWFLEAAGSAGPTVVSLYQDEDLQPGRAQPALSLVKPLLYKENLYNPRYGEKQGYLRMTIPWRPCSAAWPRRRPLRAFN